MGYTRGNMQIKRSIYTSLSAHRMGPNVQLPLHVKCLHVVMAQHATHTACPQKVALETTTVSHKKRLAIQWLRIVCRRPTHKNIRHIILPFSGDSHCKSKCSGATCPKARLEFVLGQVSSTTIGSSSTSSRSGPSCCAGPCKSWK